MSNASCGEARPPRIPGLELREKIGEGGLSVVYRAVHLNLQRGVAVKVLRAPADEASAAPAWLRESRLTAALAHPHVVAIHDAGQAGGHSYLVLEEMAGGSLRARMEPGRPWPLARAAELLDRVALALEHVHQSGVLHLDLKPENILYTADGQAKVSDFGLSVPHEDAGALLGGQHYQGTIDYAAPERRAGLPPDARFDVFSLATLAYELLTGRLPGRVYVPASRRNRRLPAALDDVLRRGLAREPSQRYATVAQFRQALAAAARRPARPRLLALGLAAGGGLAAAAILVFAQRLGKPAAPQPAEGPSRLWVLYDRPDDLSLFAGELATASGEAAERVAVGKPPRGVPPELGLPAWPAPRPALVVRSPGAWRFVHPLLDRDLGRRVVRGWPDLLRAVVPAGGNAVKSGGFDGDCLASRHQGPLWRAGDSTVGEPTRGVALGRPDDRPGDPALLLTDLEPAPAERPTGCYQALADAPEPGSVIVLRYRARALRGRGGVSVHAALPVVVPKEETGPAAGRVRALALPLPPEPLDPSPGRWWYRCPAWVTPEADWQTYLVVSEVPPFPARLIHRNLVVSVKGPGQVWVDDVELFVWRVGGEP